MLAGEKLKGESKSRECKQT